MTKRQQLPDDEQRDLTQRLFDVLTTLNDLSRASEEPAPSGRNVMGRLYAYATQSDLPEDPDLEEMLQQNSDLRADFHRLLEKTALSHLPQVAAASSGPIDVREGRGCRIRFEASRAEPSQTFVMIELSDPEMPVPGHLFVCDAENRCLKCPLPPARDGAIQILLGRDSALLDQLLDLDTEVFLR
jgi:hypothetical protein